MNISPLSFSPVGEMLVTLYVEGLSMAWCICPSPTGEARWGLMTISRSNLFLPLGKVRMGLRPGDYASFCILIFHSCGNRLLVRVPRFFTKPRYSP